MVFVIDDDEIMRECIVSAITKGASGCEVKVFGDALMAMKAISDGEIPEMIFLDIMLSGPDGFTFLNELMSYEDTAKIPIVIVTSLNMGEVDLSVYGVVGVLEKEKVTPQEISEYVKKYVG